MYTHEEQKRLNTLHVQNPQIGDHWLLTGITPYLLVVDRNDDGITAVCKTIGEVIPCYDLTHSKHLTLDELNREVRFESAPGFRAEVRPGAGLALANEWRIQQGLKEYLKPFLDHPVEEQFRALLFEYEVFGSFWGSIVWWDWGQWLLVRYLRWKADRKLARYLQMKTLYLTQKETPKPHE
jgi:hypothetical protein